MKQPCWKCGATGKNFNPDVTAIEPCSVCGGTGYLDDAVYQYPVNLPTKPMFIVQKLDLEDSYICKRLYWRTMTGIVTASEAKSIYNGLPDNELDLHRIIPTGGDE